MAKRIIELFFVLVVIFIFMMVIGKYFYPSVLPVAAHEAKNDARMQYNYLKYKTQIYSDKEAFTLPPKTKDATSVPVLLYHGIADKPYKTDVLLENFKEQMFALKKAGYETVTLAEFEEYMQGERALPEKSFLLTFDDGIKSSYYPVDPILKALDYNAVMFIITKYSLGNSSGPYYLSQQEIEEMMMSGRWEVQAHTKEGHNLITIDGSGTQGHFYGNKKWLEEERRLENEQEFRQRIRTDFIQTKEDMEQYLGIDVYAFAFPFGDMGENSLNYPEAHQAVLEEVTPHYNLVFHQHWPSKGATYNHPDQNNPFVTRIIVSRKWTGQDLLWFLEDGDDKRLPFYDDFSFNRGWMQVWGEMEIRNNSMILHHADVSNGNSVFLDGTHSFKDYIFKAKINSLKANSISLRARYENDFNYVSCDFGKGYTRIRQTTDDLTSVVAETKSTIPESYFEAAIAVKENQVQCLLNGVVVLEGTINEAELSQGGVGMRSTGNGVSINPVIIGKVSVEKYE